MCKFLNGSDSKLSHSKYPPIILQNIFQFISMDRGRAMATEERQKLKILTTKHVSYEYQIINVSLSIKL